MSLFANVYTGANPNDGTGDSLRIAFQKIDQNFANISQIGNVLVSSVAGKTGTVVLTAQDIWGAASNVYVQQLTTAANAHADGAVATLSTQVNIQIANAVSVSNTYTNSAISGISGIAANLTVLYSNIGNLYANVGTISANLYNTNAYVNTALYNIGLNATDIINIKSNVNLINANIAAANTAISTLTTATTNATNAANAAAVALVNSLQSTLNTNVSTANSAVVAFVNTQVSSLTANAGSQATAINLINANVLAANVAIGALQSNTGSLQSQINSVNANTVSLTNQVAVSNVAVISYVNTLNTAMASNVANARSYTDASIAALVNSAPATLDTLAEIAANLASEAGAIGSILNSIASTNANVATINANTGAYHIWANANVAGLSSQITNVNSAIVTANTGVVSYVNTQVQSLQINAAVQETEISGLRSNITAANVTIVTANTAMKGYVDYQISGANAALNNLSNSINSVGTIVAINANITAANVASLQSQINAANAAIVTANTAVVSYVNANTAAQKILINTINANVAAANTAIASQNTTINTINTTVNNHTANLTTGPIQVSGNIVAANIRATGGGVFFPDGTRQTTAFTTANLTTGNILFTNTTLSTINDTGGNVGITLNPANGGEIHLSSFVGINNTNPGYWLEVGDWSDKVNTGNIAISFGNPATSYKNTVIWDWDWLDAGAVGHTNGSGTHATFGLYNWLGTPGSGTTRAYITFDANSAAAVAPIQVNANGSVLLSNVTVSSNLITTNRPSFKVYGSTDSSPNWTAGVIGTSGNVTVTVDHNIGNYYNATTGRFTASVTGLYHVFFNGLAGSAHQQGSVIIRKNGLSTAGNNICVASSINGDAGGQGTFSISTTARLTAGEYIDAFISTGSIAFNSGQNWGAYFIG